MATIHKLTKDGATIFPATITDAVVHPQTGKTLTSMMKDYNVSELFPTEGVDGGNKYNLALAIQVLGTHLTSAQKTGGIKLTFISSVSNYEEEYYLGKSSWSTTASDWDQRFEVGDVVADPSGSWTPSTAEAYIDQQIATEATIRLDQDVYTRSLIPLADEEDLTKSGSYLKFKDRTYNQISPNGMGRVILRNNLINGINTLTQSMINQANTIYVIQYDFDLNGAEITIPANCVLEFDGGSLKNGKVIGNNTFLSGNITGDTINLLSGSFLGNNGEFLNFDKLPFTRANVIKENFRYADSEVYLSGYYATSVCCDNNYIYQFVANSDNDCYVLLFTKGLSYVGKSHITMKCHCNSCFIKDGVVYITNMTDYIFYANVSDIVTDGDVIKVYYVKDNFGYTIEYYYDNNKDDSKTETSSALYQSIIDSYTDKNITGYKFDKTENLPLTITENSDNNVIKVYYVKDSFGYTVEYYYDNVKDNSKTESSSAEYQSIIDSYTDKNITGYKFDKTENLPLTISEIATNNVIKVYYVKDNFGYKVEYYYDNVKDDSKTESGTAEYQSTIDSYTDKNITGYKFDKTENLPLTITENADNNVIKVYYVKDNFEYTVEYYYDNVKDDTKTESSSAEYQSTINSYTDKNITGYKFDKTENLPLTISENADNNVIKVYYVKDNFGYTVEYYYDNVKDDSKTDTGSGLYQSTINNYTDKNITGYRFDKTENFPLTITENPSNNIIKVYYILDDGNTKTLSYTVEYYKDNVKVEGDTQTRTKTVQILDPDTLEIDRSLINNNNKYVGYKIDRTDPANVPDIVTNGDVIKVYYIKDSFAYTIEYYYDNVKDDSKTESSSAEYQSQITTYTNKNITGYKFDKAENLPLTISENPTKI